MANNEHWGTTRHAGPVRAIGWSPAVGLLALLLSACTAATIRGYSGPQLPAEQIAVLRHQTGFNNPSVYFIRVDDVSFQRLYGDIEILPGRHEVEFGFEAAGMTMTYSYSTENAVVDFEASANHEYEARVVRLPPTSILTALAGEGRWTGIIVDLGTGERVDGGFHAPTPAENGKLPTR